MKYGINHCDFHFFGRWAEVKAVVYLSMRNKENVWEHLLPRVEIEWCTEWNTDKHISVKNLTLHRQLLEEENRRPGDAWRASWHLRA